MKNYIRKVKNKIRGFDNKHHLTTLQTSNHRQAMIDETVQYSMRLPSRLIAIGTNSYHQLSSNYPAHEASEPQKGKLVAVYESIPDPIKQISCGSIHSSVLTTTGLVYVFGDNAKGQLSRECGNSQATPHCIDYFVQNNIKIAKIAAGGWNTIFLSEDQQLYVLGEFSTTSGNDNYFAVTLIRTVAPVINIACGNRFCFYQCSNLEVYRIGICPEDNAVTIHTLYQTSHAEQKPVDFAIGKIDAGESCVSLLTRAGAVYDFDSVYKLFIERTYFRENKIDILDISCTWSYTVVISTDIQLYFWSGCNSQVNHLFNLGRIRQTDWIIGTTAHNIICSPRYNDQGLYYLFRADQQQGVTLGEIDPDLTKKNCLTTHTVIFKPVADDQNTYETAGIHGGYFHALILHRCRNDSSKFYSQLLKHLNGQYTKFMDVTFNFQ
jgi:alpha-tubulin suppressor-like RCC1 family protein